MSDAMDEAMGQMVDLLGKSTAFSNEPGHPELLSLAVKDSVARPMIVLCAYSTIMTDDPALWNFVGQALQAFYPERIAAMSIEQVNAYSQGLMDSTQTYVTHWNNYPQMDQEVPQSLATLMLTWHHAMMLDPRHASFVAFSSTDWFMTRMTLISKLPE